MHFVAAEPDRERLERIDQELADLQRSVLEELESISDHAGELDASYAERFRDTAERLAYRLNEELPPDLDPSALAEIRDIILRSLEALSELDESRPLDIVDRFLVSAEAIRHLVRDALDEHVGDKGDRRELMRTLGEWLPRISQPEQTRLAGISVRQFQRWAKDSGAPSRRLLLVVQLVALLRRSWSPEGVIAWFDRPRAGLDGKAPIEVLDDAESERRLLIAVRQGRAQHGA
jgi:hypothetical protein